MFDQKGEPVPQYGKLGRYGCTSSLQFRAERSMNSILYLFTQFECEISINYLSYFNQNNRGKIEFIYLFAPNYYPSVQKHPFIFPF